MTNSVLGAKSRNFQRVDSRHAFIPLISFQYTFISYEKFFESYIKSFFFLFYFSIWKYNDFTCETSCMHNHRFILDKLLLRE